MKIVDDGSITKKQYDALTVDERLNYWQVNGNKFVLISKLDDAHLQKAFCYAQKKELEFHNKVSLFSELVSKIEQEGENREITLADLDTKYHKNQRRHKDKRKVKA